MFITSSNDTGDTAALALTYVRRHKAELIERFASDEICPSQTDPLTYFMAGSPGAGKTEFSKRFIERSDIQAVRIDADEIKGAIPYYTGGNSNEVQGASAMGLQKIFDYCLNKKKTAVVDGTFASYKHSVDDVKRSLKRGRPVEIFYIYQDPLLSWDFAKAREAIEGRPIPKEFFISSLFQSIENVNAIKKNFGEDVKIHLIKKGYDHNLDKYHENVQSLDPFLKIPYNIETLNEILLDQHIEHD